MADLTGALQAAAGTAASAGGATDPNFNQTVLLLHGDGTNGAQNNTFLDSSSNTFTITRNGNTTQGSFSPFSNADGEWSNYFGSVPSTSNDRLVPSSSASAVFGTGQFTIEAWVWTTTKDVSGANRTWLGNTGSSSQGQCYINTSGYVVFGNTGLFSLTGNTDVADGSWHHIAISRSGTGTNQCALFVDGVRQAVGTNAVNYTTATLYIGINDGTNGDWIGGISNLRIVNGSYVYDPASSTVTVPTTPLTAITNTALLTCQSNRFLDNSTNGYTFTVGGAPSVQPFSPFAPSAAYDVSVNGGSAYLDGTGDYLTFTKNTTSGAFTCECWFYRGPNVSGAHNVFAGSNIESVNADNIQFIVSNTGGIGLTMVGVVIGATGTAVTRNAWSHLVWVRDSSNNVATFVNGNRISTATTSAALNVVSVGCYFANHSPNGYIADARIVDDAVYDPTLTTLTVPTAPLTAVSNTYLLTNFTNAGIFDNTAKNDLETVGNAQVDTSVVKYGQGSMKFDGAGDNLLIPDTANFDFGTGDFTIEFWLYRNNTTGDMALIDGRSGVSTGWLIYLNATSKIVWFVNSAVITGSTTIGSGSFYHIAIARSGTSVKLFVDGTEDGSATNSTSTDSGAVSIGSKSPGASGSSIVNLNGFIDDLRITKGVARYTANFTPPTAAFPDL